MPTLQSSGAISMSEINSEFGRGTNLSAYLFKRAAISHNTAMAELVFDQQERVGTWVAKQVGQGASWGDFYAIGVVRGEDIIAGVVINNYNGANATCHIAIAQQTKAIIPLVQAVCDYAFRHCGLKRLTGMVPTNEPHIIAFDKHLGFEEEFVMKHGAPGADMQVLVMWADKCRWLPKE